MAFMAPRPPTASSPSQPRSEPIPTAIEPRLLELGGNPPGLGDKARTEAKLPEALDAMLLRPELAFIAGAPDAVTSWSELIDRGLVAVSGLLRTTVRVTPTPQPV